MLRGRYLGTYLTLASVYYIDLMLGFIGASLFLQEIEHLYCENAAVHKNDWIRLQKLYLPIAARA